MKGKELDRKVDLVEYLGRLTITATLLAVFIRLSMPMDFYDTAMGVGITVVLLAWSWKGIWRK